MNKQKIFSHWLPLFLWLLLIYILSAQVKNETEQTSGLILTILQALGLGPAFIQTYHIHFWVRKLAHFTEYFVLFFLLSRVLRLYKQVPVAIVLSWFLAVLYACTDEWHQSMVPGRGAAITDVGIDAMGAGLAALLQAYFLSRKNKKSLTFVE